MSSLTDTFDRRVTIQENIPSLDGAGQTIENWMSVTTAWMGIKPARGNEKFLAQQVVGKAVTTFRCRYVNLDFITVKHRLVFDGKNWDIHDVREVGRQEGLEIDASARSD